MRQFDYWGAWQDSRPALAEMMNTGAVLAFFDQPHAEPSARMYSTLGPELEQRLRERGGVQLWVPGASILPLSFGRLESGKHPGSYYVKSGGPYITFLMATDYEDGEDVVISYGHIACATSFYDQAMGRDVHASTLMTDTYERFVKILRSGCRRMGPNRYWVGNVAARMLDERIATIRSPGFHAIRGSRQPRSGRGQSR